MSNFFRYKDILDLEYRVLYFSIMEKTHIEIETNIGERVRHMCNHTIICRCDCPPAVSLAEGLADDHRNRLLAVPRDCLLKIKFVRHRLIRAVWTVP